MHRKILSPINSLHYSTSILHNITKPFTTSQNTGESLVAHLSSILRACSGLQQGKQVHARVIANGTSQNNNQLGSQILRMYVLCGSFTDAKNIFYNLDLCCSMPWNLVIRGFSALGYFKFSILFYFKMLGYGVYPDRYTFPSVIKACSGLNNAKFGKMVHLMICSMGLEIDVFVGSALVKLYADNGWIDDARYVFDKLSERDCVLWNAMLNGYAKCGKVDCVFRLFQEMRNTETKANSVTYACVLFVSAAEAMINLGSQIHALVVRCGLDLDSLVSNSLLSMYSKCGVLFDARKLFDSIPQPELVSWNGMIAGYVQNGFMREASDCLYKAIFSGVKPDSITFSSFLPSVSESADLNRGKEIHGYIIRHGVCLDVFLKSALIDTYFKCREVETAFKIFSQSATTDVGMCTVTISGLVLNGLFNDALKVFRQLLQTKIVPNELTISSTLTACSGLAALKLGKELHGNVLRTGVDIMCHVGTAITGMYAKCGRLDLAQQIFRRMSDKDAVCWNQMITSYSQNSKPEEAIEIFRQIGINGVKYDSVSISAALSACTNIPALHYGKEIHGFIIKRDFTSDIFAESALIDMYAKCGNLDLAYRVFETMHMKSEVAWNSIISAYGTHGHLKKSLLLFHEMLEKGFQPDHVTFLCILSACGHAGHVNNGVRYFNCMTEEYGIKAQMEHYACMVDLFGRAGDLKQAFETIKNMPFSPDAGVWGTLLGACRVHGNVKLAELAGRHLFELDPQNSGYYVLLSNIFADAGRWAGVVGVRSLMKQKGVRKVPGYSWIDVNNTRNTFVASDESHLQSVEIYSVLDNLLLELRREGYVPKIYRQTMAT